MHPFLISIGTFHLPTYGALLVAAILGGIFTAMRLGRRSGLDPGMILDFCTWLILVALVGAKVLMILTEWNETTDHLSQIFSLSTLMAGGVFYGGFLAAFFFALWYVRVQKVPFWKLVDVLAPGVALGQSVGRLGCFSAGCDYGKPTTVPWGVTFTNTFAHQVAGVPLGVRLHPAQLYESFATFAIFGFLLWWFPRKKHEGDVFLVYTGLYATARFFLEFLRGDEDRGFVFHHLLSTSQFIALVALGGIAALLIWRAVRGRDKLSAGAAKPAEGRGAAAHEAAAQGGFGKVQAATAAPVAKRAKH